MNLTMNHIPCLPGGSLFARLPRFGEEKKTVRVGIVGAGGMGNRHADILSRFDNVKIAAVASGNKASAENLAGRTGANAYGDVKSMLDTEAIDALFITVTPDGHGDIEAAAIKKGIPFLVEKPIDTDLKTARKIERAVRKKGLITSVGYHWRYLDTVEMVKELVRNNPPLMAVAHWMDRTPPPLWWRRMERSGGQIVEQATHLLDLLRNVMGEAVSVKMFAFPANRPEFPDSNVDDVSAGIVKFKTGAVANVMATTLKEGEPEIGVSFYSPGFTLKLDRWGKRLTVSDQHGVREIHSHVDEMEREDRDFIEAVSGGENRIRSTYTDALRTQEMAVKLQRSAKSS